MSENYTAEQQAALAQLDAVETPSEPTPSATPEATPPSGPVPVEVQDDTLLSFKDGDEVVQKSWAEVFKERLMNKDYTRKTQDLAEQRRRFDAEREEILAQRQALEGRMRQLAQVIRNPQALEALKAAAARQAGPPMDPNRPVTMQDLIRFQQSLQQRFDQSVEGKLQSFGQNLTRAQTQERLHEDLVTFGTGLIKQHPELAALEGIEEAVFHRVFNLRPTDLNEAKQYTQKIIEEMAERLQASIEEQRKQAVAAKNKAADGTEPRGGAPVLPKPQKFETEWEKEKAMMEFVTQLESL